MNELAKNPFDALLDAFRAVVREEIKSFSTANERTEKLLLDTQEAARFLNVPSTWLAEAAREGKIKSVKLGHYVRFARGDLEAFIQQQMKKDANQ